MNYDLPKYIEFYEKVVRHVQLPQYTHYLFQFGQFNDEAFTLPVMAVLACVILADFGLPYVLGPSIDRRRLHSIWFVSTIVLGVLMILAYFIAFQPMHSWVPHWH